MVLPDPLRRACRCRLLPAADVTTSYLLLFFDETSSAYSVYLHFTLSPSSVSMILSDCALWNTMVDSSFWTARVVFSNEAE